QTREEAARRADACFRGSLPGDPMRERTLRALAALRYDGLDLERFDREEPAERFFTNEASDPTLDAIDVTLGFMDTSPPGRHRLIGILEGARAKQELARCFIVDWNSRHERSALGTLRLSVRSGRPSAEAEGTPLLAAIELRNGSRRAPSAFEACAVRSLQPLLSAPFPLEDATAWEQLLTVRASLD
ncbi:MAG: hypothetical protein OEY14_13125, partial [Myxococcales bacterium]|nr:hypothetical protein [Myxococcales bacterium]